MSQTSTPGRPGDSIDPAALLRHLEGRASTAEQDAIAGWLASSATNREELARLQEAWNLAAVLPPSDIDADALWERIRGRLDEPHAAPEEADEHGAGGALAGTAPGRPGHAEPAAGARPAAPAGWRRAGLVVRWGLAAALVIIGAVHLLDRRSTRDTAPQRPPLAYRTRAGEVMRLALPDGSRAILSGASVLEVPRDYGNGSREVRLDGQAYFEVADVPSVAFRVRTPRTLVEDLGTRFTVIAYRDDEQAEVAVAQGSVAVMAGEGGERAVLDSADVAYVSADGAVRTLRDVPLDRYLGWVDGVLHFDQESLAEAAQQIERRFGITVRITDAALARRRFTGSIGVATFDRDLRALALLLDARYERQARAVVLSPAR